MAEKLQAIIFDLNGVLVGPDSLLVEEKDSEWFEGLHKKGILLFVLSNGSPSQVRSNKLLGLTIRKYFTAEYYSTQTGNLKPDADSFLQPIAEYNLDPARCLVIDDSPHNIAGATQTGLVGLLYESAGQVKDYLK